MSMTINIFEMQGYKVLTITEPIINDEQLLKYISIHVEGRSIS